AEDGIRDLTVTGVHTCALPISCRRYVPGRVSPPTSWNISSTSSPKPIPAPRENTAGRDLDLPSHASSLNFKAELCWPKANWGKGDRKSVVEGKKVERGGRRARG